MRKRLFEILDTAKDGDRLSEAYDSFMMIVIIVSIIPLAIIEDYKIFRIIDVITVSIFIIDYVLRLITADFKLKRGAKSFILYIFTPMAIFDLLSILPAITFINSSLKLFRIFRLIRTFRVFRVFKVVRYSKNIQLLIKVFNTEKKALLTILGAAVIYILISALVVLNVEPETFKNYFRAIYWATVSLTTIGYGDIYPTSVPGQIVTMISSFIGIAIIAMPTGVITAGFMKELAKNNNSKDKEN